METLKKTVSDVTDKLTKKKIELMVNEATSNEPWGVPNTLLGEIAEKTYYGKDCEDCVAIISKKLQTPGREFNRIYKILTLVEYLLRHGSNTCCDALIQFGQTIRTFQEFSFNDNGKEKGQGVREKARLITALMSDNRLLTQERDAARDTKRKYVGIGAGDYIGSGSFDNYRPSQNYDRSSSYQTPTNTYQTPTNTYQTPTNTYQTPTNSYQTSNTAVNSELRSDRYERPNQSGSFSQGRPNQSGSFLQGRPNLGVNTAYVTPEISQQPANSYPDLFNSKAKTATFSKPPVFAESTPKSAVPSRMQMDLIQEAPANVDLFAPKSKQGADILIGSPSKNVDIFNQPPKTNKSNMFVGLTSKKKPETTDSIQPKSSDLMGLTSDLFQPASTPAILPELFTPVSASQPVLQPTHSTSQSSYLTQPKEPEKPKFIPQVLSAQLYQASGLTQPQTQPTPAQPSIPELPKPKINLNLAETSGPTISQLQSTPSLSQKPNTDKLDTESSKPKNIEETLLNLDGLGASLSSSKVLPSVRKYYSNY